MESQGPAPVHPRQRRSRDRQPSTRRTRTAGNQRHVRPGDGPRPRKGLRMNAKRMTAAEAVMLCRFAKACCPQQAIDEYTPDAWHELLSDLRFEDCKAAVVDVVKEQPFVSPAEIRSRIAKVRANRHLEFGPF